MGVNLDRFSVSLSHERISSNDGPYEVEYQTPVLCEGCRKEIHLEFGEHVESEIYEDEYIHDNLKCIHAYYNEKAPIAGNNQDLDEMKKTWQSIS